MGEVAGGSKTGPGFSGSYFIDVPAGNIYSISVSADDSATVSGGGISASSHWDAVQKKIISASAGTNGMGKIASETNRAGTTTNYSANALNQYLAVGDFVPEYDADGNAILIKTATGTWRISYNGENPPVRFECADTQTVVEMKYDALGRQFEEKVTVAVILRPA